MNTTTTTHPRLLGLGTYRPRRRVDNAEICRTLDSSPEWIVRRSGIRTRAFATPDETLVEMAATAAGKALADAGVAPGDVDELLVATMSDVAGADRDLPAAVAARAGIPARAAGVGAACAGFTVALALAATSVRAGSARHVLVIGAERMSDLLDPRDRSTAFLFADGAGAVLVGEGQEPGIGPVVWGTDTELIDAITVRAEPGGPPRLRMQGSPVFRWAVKQLPDVIRAALARSGLAPGDVAAFVPHQANLRIIEAATQAVGFPPEVAIARDVVDQGNTSAASIPLALDRLRAEGAVASGDVCLLAGFGSGLTYAALAARMP
ncbi:beta-ketoacyl-ACP synthase 3 [Streptomyces coryli]|uniref:beta-ketoacyl-ACP synthase 3 n=1 Tax=Streptomyces coryli TaxID=1128680 RepID=UPI0030B91540